MKTNWTKESLRAFELKLCEEFKEKKINCPLHLSGGNEEHLIRIFENIKEDDYVFSTHRSHYHYLLKGGLEEELLNEIYGKSSGICKGTGRSMHIYDFKRNFFTSAIVAGCCTIACGVGLALKKEQSKQVVWCFIGDGAEDSGHFIESVRFALARDLPVIFVVEDNDFSIDSSKKERWHNYCPVEARNVIRYNYEREYPHVGVGEWVTF